MVMVKERVLYSIQVILKTALQEYSFTNHRAMILLDGMGDVVSLFLDMLIQKPPTVQM